MQDVSEYISFMQIGWEVFTQCCLLGEVAVAWSYNKEISVLCILTVHEICARTTTPGFYGWLFGPA